ncbi:MULTISPECIES: hypothetical protein [Nonomuraea]|uniref:DUF4190 domain-containing protein n=2 Tax=Nonomuraea TaxID=83681 RepID=A0ABW1C7C7_9ACTN|nr:MULTISPECIES: hypothetical protein [Nonomuraea]MDA0641377.1 hypothetical protein [Nonomuraea ferruginea]
MSMPPPQQPQQPRSTGVVVGLAVVGLFAYIVVNVFVGVVAVSMATNVVLALAAGFLAVGALGGGVVLLSLRRPWSKGLGLGLMIGWGLVSIVSAGWCTGLNPGLYA